MFGRNGSKMVITGTYKGACPAGMKPGDIETDQGVKMNTQDAMNQARQLSEALKSGAMQDAFDADDAGEMGEALSQMQKNMSPEQLQAIQKAMQQMGGGGR
jgi:hypothetical protein